MANEQNLTHKLTEKEQRAGGKKSAEVRRKKKTVQNILNDFLSSAADKSPQFAELAEKLGVETGASVKDLFTIACVLNTIKNGDISDLEKLMRLLGESVEVNNSNGILESLLTRLNDINGD